MTGSAPGRREFVALASGAAALALLPAAARAARRQGGGLKHVGLEPWSFDAQASLSPATQMASSFVRRTLLKRTHGARPDAPAATPRPDLALRWRVSPDGRVYTFALRPGVRWEDRPPVNGRELTAADVKHTLERALRLSPDAARLGPVQAVETPDRRTVRLHLAEPFAPLLSTLAEPWLGILAPEVEDRFGSLRSAASLIGCGPFTLARHEPGVKAVFARNPDYYQPELPYLDRVDWLFLGDRATHLSLFAGGQVDIPSHDAGVPRAVEARLRESSPPFPVRFWDGLAAGSLAMRADRPPFSDVRVRRALGLAIDRRQWVARHHDGHGVEDPGPVPASMREWKLAGRDLGEGARYLEHDPAMARKLLADAGFPGGLKVRCVHSPGAGPETARDLELLSRSLAQIGVELTVVSGEPGGPGASRPEETSWGSSPAFTDVDGYLYGAFKAGHPGNRSGVADARLDALLQAQRQATSRPERWKAVAAIQRHVADRVYYVYPPCPLGLASWAPWVRGYAPGRSLDRGAQLETVWLERP